MCYSRVMAEEENPRTIVAELCRALGDIASYRTEAANQDGGQARLPARTRHSNPLG